MTQDAALALVQQFVELGLVVVGPVLLAALLAGVATGICQTITQINDVSLGFVVKAASVVVLLLVIGGVLAEKTTRYTRDQLSAVAGVVH
ncbi:MAG: flagellar biosynthetic protein FliQ [Polyangiaceae bacterium]|nr:flagellar biosynthetic protein FliQ [Polyangiaceae bacterium]